MSHQKSFQFPPFSATALAVFFALGLNAPLPAHALTSKDNQWNAVSNATVSDPDEKTATSGKPISLSSLRKAVKVAAESSTSKLRRELMTLISEQLDQSGIDFSPTATDKSDLRELGATDELLAIIARKGRERVAALELHAWQMVKASSDATEINAFLQKYPATQFAAEAQLRLQELRWESLQVRGRAGEFTQFLADYPDSQYASAAQNRIEQFAWQAAQTGGRAEDFAQYLQTYPRGQFAASAQNRLSQIAWDKIRQSRDVARFVSFVEQYPQGTLADAARIRIEQLRWEMVLSGGKKSDFEAYLQQYPNGNFASTARHRIERINNPKSEDQAEEVEPVKLEEAELRQYLTREVLPQLTAETARKRVSKVRLVLSVMGTIQSVEPLDGSKAARAAIIETVGQWAFRPVEREGKVVVAEGVITLRYADNSPKASTP